MRASGGTVRCRSGDRFRVVGGRIGVGIMGGPGRPGDASMNEEAAKDATSVTDRNPDRGDGGRDAGREPGRDAEDVRRGREEGLAALRILEATR
ncbi:MAG: hypothetical protein KGR25_10080, partial [Chloroflexi bacterium]|nr:hypothetical protein [Chloroflexota bacterium]